MVTTNTGFSVTYLQQLYYRVFRCATCFASEGDALNDLLLANRMTTIPVRTWKRAVPQSILLLSQGARLAIGSRGEWQEDTATPCFVPYQQPFEELATVWG